MKQRIHYIDIAKGILILSLMYTHLYSANKIIGVNNDYFNILYYFIPFIACFFMQCFFMISGYCSNFDNNFSTFIKRQWRQILVPWICFEFISKISSTIYWDTLSIENLYHQLITPPNTGLCFFSALFFSKLYLWITLQITKKHSIIIYTSLVLLIIALYINEYDIGQNILAIRNSLAACFFVSFGFYLKGQKMLYKYLLKSGYIIFPTSLLILKLLHLKIPILDAGVSNVGLIYIPIILILTISGSFTILFISDHINKNKILEYFGRNSIIIYGLHFLPLVMTINFYFDLINPQNIYSLILTTILIYSTLAIILILIISIVNTKYLKWIIGK